MLPTAPLAMNAGGCSSARMIIAASPAVGREAISAPMNGPERSTTIEAATTIEAVMALLNRRARTTASIALHLEAETARLPHDQAVADRYGEAGGKRRPFADDLRGQMYADTCGGGAGGAGRGG